MGFLAGKKILITGVLSNRSIAYGVARACQREGATLAFTYVNDELKDRVVKLAAEFGSVPVLPCDVTRDEDIDALFAAVRQEWGGLDGLLHSIAFAPREALAGDFLEGLSRAAFATAHDVSSYSFAALAKGARPLMQGRNAALVTLTYLGAVRALPSYNVMGLAKASLEASVRYLAACLGPERCASTASPRARSRPSPPPASAASRSLLRFVERTAPLRRNVTIEEVGNVAAFLLSDLASGITGEITYVDCGFSTIAAGMSNDECTSRTASPARAFDAVVVGGGHNGLVCAAYLADGGLRGVRARAACGARRRGDHRRVPSRVSQLDGELHGQPAASAGDPRPAPRRAWPARSWSGRSPTSCRCPTTVTSRSAAGSPRRRRNSRDSPRAMRSVCRRTTRCSTASPTSCASSCSKTPPNVGGGARASISATLLDGWKAARAFRALGIAGQRDVLDLFTKSAGDVLDRWFEAEPVKAAFGFDAIVGNFASPYTPGSAYVLLHHVLR